MKYLTVRAVADELECSDSYAYSLVPTMPGAFKLGRIWKIAPADLQAYIEERKRCRSLRDEKTAQTSTPGSRTPRRGERGESRRASETAELHRSLLKDENGAPLIRPIEPGRRLSRKQSTAS